MLKHVSRATPFARALLALRATNHEPKKLDRQTTTYRCSQLFHSGSRMMRSNVTEGLSEQPEDPHKAISASDQHKLGEVLSRVVEITRNPNSLISTEFFSISKYASENNVRLDELFSSTEFKEMEKQIEKRIGILGNATITSLIVSLITMKADPSIGLVKLLEQTIESRRDRFNFNQTLKMLKFYVTSEFRSKPRQTLIISLLSERLLKLIESGAPTLEQLNSVLRLVSTEQEFSSWLYLVERKLSDMLIEAEVDRKHEFDYESLCTLFIESSKNKRTSARILNMVSMKLCKIPAQKILDQAQPRTILILNTLGAMVELNYSNKILVSKLMDDLREVIDLNRLDSYGKRGLLHTIRVLRWRSPDILAMYFRHIIDNKRDSKEIDHRLVASLLRVSAELNYRYKDINRFYNQCVKGDMEDAIDKCSWKWLDHVWSLVNLNVAEESHLRSVVNDRFYQLLASNSQTTAFHHLSSVRLLNLYAIAHYELNLTNLSCRELIDSSNHSDMHQPSSAKDSMINSAINELVDCHGHRQDIKTPLGFVINYELLLNKDLEFLPLEGSFEDSIREVDNGGSKGPIRDPNRRKCALINVHDGQRIVNAQDEAVCNKQIISRILKIFGYETVFLFEDVVSNEKTVKSLAARIRSLIVRQLG